MTISTKKAMWSLAMTASLILALIFTGIGVTMVKNIGERAKTGFDKGICKESVIWNAKYRLPYEEGEQFQINCPTRYVKIGLDKITVETAESEQYIIPMKGIGDLKDIKSKEKFFAIVNPFIADLNFDCWDQFAAGQLAVFNKYDKDSQCLICSRIEFSKDVIDALGKSWYSGTSDYSLEEYMVTHTPRSHDIRYVEFLMDPVDVFRRPPYEYMVSEPMAVVFTALNSRTFYTAIGELYDAGKKYILRDSSQPEGQDEFVNKLDFIPYNQIKDQCKVLV